MRALIVVWTALFTVPLAAAPPRMDVQGRLASLAGLGVDGAYTLTFRIWDAETGGTASFTEVHVGVPAVSGRFSATLGISEPLDPASFADGGPRWLGVQVEAEPELPRQPLASVAYAFHASTSALAHGLSCTGCVTEEALAFALPPPLTSVDGLDGGTLLGDLDLSGHQLTSFRVHNATSEPKPCTADAAGMIYFDTQAKVIVLCNGAEWKPLAIQGPLGSPDNPAVSCKAILSVTPSAPDGIYYLLGSNGITYQTQCDMTSGGYTEIVSWNRVDDGQTKAQFEAVFTKQINTMTQFEEQGSYIRWGDFDSTTDALAYSKGILFANGGEWRVDLHSEHSSMDDSGVWYFFRNAAGATAFVACQDDTAGQPYTAAEKTWLEPGCPVTKDGNHTFKSVYTGKVTGSLVSFHLHSLHYDGSGGDESRLYRVRVWVR